jgi:hypothetical protein
VVTPGYFRTLHIPVIRGREFTDADDANPIQSFIVNEAFAKAYLRRRWTLFVRTRQPGARQRRRH